MRPKILYILNSCVMGGATISFLNLAKGMAGKGYDIIVVVPKYDLEFVGKIEAFGGKCIVGKIAFSFYHKKSSSSKGIIDIARIILSVCRTYLKKIISLYSLYKIVKKERPNIIHTNVGVIHEGYYVGKLLSIPHVWHLREYQDLDFDVQVLPSKGAFCKILNRSYVITITDDIRHYFHLDNCKTAKTIYNGILHKNEVYNIYPKQNYFLCASRISPEKGHEETINVFARFYKNHLNYKLVVLGFGEDEYIQNLKKKAVELGCDNSIEWIGYTEHVTDYMKNATALLVNSQFEGFGRMTAEAIFCNCLVIGRNTGGTREILQQTGGYLYDSEQGMLSSMEEVSSLGDDEYKLRANTSCNKALHLFSIEENIEKTSQFYEAILSY